MTIRPTGDWHLDRLRVQRVREYYELAAAPFLAEIIRMRAIFTNYRMTVDNRGRVISSETTLPDDVRQYVSRLEVMIEQCWQMALKEGERWP